MDKELYENIVEGNDQKVQILIEKNNSLLETRWKNGRTLLHVAAQKNHDHLIQLLVGNYHMDVNACDTNGTTPLSDASALGCLRSVCALLKQKDIDIEKSNKHGISPLHRAAFSNHTKVALLLLSAGSNCNATDCNDWTPLHAACFLGAANLEIVKILLQQKTIQIDATNTEQRTPLHLAAAKGHTEVVFLLLSAGSNCNATNRSGWTPLHEACWLDTANLEIVKILLQQKTIQIDATNKEERTPLHLAAAKGHTEVVFLLLSAGSNCNATNKSGWTPLHEACWSDKANLEIVKILLQQKTIQIDATNKEQRTPLHLAILKGHTEVVLLLLSAGSNCNAVDIFGHTPLTSAASKGDKAAVLCLLEKGANVDAQDNNKHSSLHHASHQGHEAIVHCLLEEGADVDAQDMNGETALHLAAISSHEPTVRCLLEAGADPTCADTRGNLPLNLLPQPQDPVLLALLTPETGVEYALQIKPARGPFHP